MPAASVWGDQPRADDAHSDLAELRAAALRLFAVAVLALAGGAVLLELVNADVREPASLLAIGVLVGSGLVAWREAPRRPSWGAVILVGGLLGALVITVCVYPGTSLVYMAILVVVTAGLLRGPALGFASAAGVSAMGFVLPAVSMAPLPDGAPTVLLTLVWLGAAVAWLGTWPTRSAVSWAWHSYNQTIEKIQEVRERQAELGRLSKSLTEVCIRLEQLNQDLVRARHEADEARRLKSEFAATVSHELRTPLNLIIGFAEMMMVAPQSYAGATLPESYRGDLDAIYRNACQLSSLLDDVLDLSQVDAHRFALQKEHVALARIIDQATATVANLFKDAGLYLKVDLPAHLSLVNVDPTRIKQVLINLLSNAVRYTDDGGVTVTATGDDREVVVSVTDTGVGIPPEELPHMFQEFRRGAGPQRRKGSGLGLAVSKRFVELHGGNMWAESTPGAGSTFCFSLPLAGNVVASAVETDWEARVRGAPGAGERVIAVVGQNHAAAGIFRRYLDGFRVVGPLKPSEARRLAREGMIHAVILGDAVTGSEARANGSAAQPFPRIPVVACNLRTPSARRDELGVQGYLVKPVARPQVAAALRSLGRDARKVLVVEDDPELSRLLKKMVSLVSRRYQVRQAFDGATALAAMRADRPDVVLLDLVLPEVDGYEVLQAMRASPELRSVPVVVVTGNEGSDEAIVAGAVSLTQTGGLTIAEVMRYLRGGLEGLERIAPASPV
ncbi:MAG: response regulator [Chloroflexi bacterium]|nr:response regulator [Chloroflexota bacterium]